MNVDESQVRAIAKEAYIYGFPLVDNYRIQHSYFVNRNGPEFKGNWNQIHNTARVYTPDDKAIQTPNSDTPYSWLGVDLRAEPLVLTVPAIEQGRYYSIQFIDMYTFNFAYVGTRATGNGAGAFLLAGPSWNGAKPDGVRDVIRCETELAFLIYRTQLLGSDDIENVKKVQAGYRVEALSTFLGQPAPAAPPAIDFIAPLTPDAQKTSPQFFNELSFVLQFCPTNPSEAELMARFAQLGIGAGRFDPHALAPNIRKAVEDGMADAWKTFAQYKATEIDTGKRTSADGFGSRAFLNGDYLARMTAAVLGIYGNSREEAIYPAYFVDSNREHLDGSKHRYALRFAPGRLPPVDAFWSLTLYELPQSLLYANALNRYLINSSMVPSLKSDADGGITLAVQHESPGPDREANWLPAPAGPFLVAMRLYMPKPEALDGGWNAPPLERIG